VTIFLFEKISQHMRESGHRQFCSVRRRRRIGYITLPQPAWGHASHGCTPTPDTLLFNGCPISAIISVEFHPFEHTLLISLTRKLGPVSYRAQVKQLLLWDRIPWAAVLCFVQIPKLCNCVLLWFLSQHNKMKFARLIQLKIHTSTINFYSCYSVLRYCHLITTSKEGVELGFVGTLWAHPLQPWGQLLGLFKVRSQHEEGDGSWCRSPLKDIYTLVKPNSLDGPYADESTKRYEEQYQISL